MTKSSPGGRGRGEGEREEGGGEGRGRGRGKGEGERGGGEGREKGEGKREGGGEGEREGGEGRGRGEGRHFPRHREEEMSGHTGTLQLSLRGGTLCDQSDSCFLKRNNVIHQFQHIINYRTICFLCMATHAAL